MPPIPEGVNKDRAFHQTNQRGHVMSKLNAVSSKAHVSKLVAMAVCLWPAVAGAQQSWNPTASDNYYNTAGGKAALNGVTGHSNTAFGYYALSSTGSSATGNTGVGMSALSKNSTGADNTGVGASALYFNTTGSYNTAVGDSALGYNGVGSLNTALGHYTLLNNTSGTYNTATGESAMLVNTSGGFNSATGANALFSNTSGSYNTADGLNALYSNTSGGYNTANGVDALYFNTIGGYNTATGGYALYLNSTGKQNTSLGVNALYANTTGANNVAVGFGALKSLTGHSSGNIALGTNAGFATKSGNNNIYIGHSGISGAGESNVTRIGHVQTKVFVAGIKGVPLKGASVVVNAAGQLGVVASSARYKTNIRSLSSASDKLAQLRPVSYEYKTEPGATHYGLIAEEVDKVMPELVVRDEQNRPESVQYQELIPLLLQQWKAQQAENARQRELITQQNVTIERLSSRVDELSRTRLAGRSTSK
jgi:hypothetical protein